MSDSRCNYYKEESQCSETGRPCAYSPEDEFACWAFEPTAGMEVKVTIPGGGKVTINAPRSADGNREVFIGERKIGKVGQIGGEFYFKDEVDFFNMDAGFSEQMAAIKFGVIWHFAGIALEMWDE